MYTQQFSHFIIILIDTRQLFVTEHPAGEAGYSVMSLELLTVSHPRSREGRKEKEKKNQVWPQKYKGYACNSKLYECMFPGSPCCTQTETNGNAPCSLIILVFQYASYKKSRRYV